MGQIYNTEKINIGVPNKIGVSLKRDAELFEVFKNNSMEINLNRFLSALILGYYYGYKEERNETVNQIKDMVSPFLRDQKMKDVLAENLMNEVLLPAVPKRKGKNPMRLSLKPTLETDQIITEIRNDTDSDDYPAQYLCRMFMSYCEKPIYERERIIYREKVDFLEEACREGREISFATTTNPNFIHHVIPYEIVYGAEEMFNYLLCQEYINNTRRNEAVSYRLCRINRPSYSRSSGSMDANVISYLEMMKKYGPQYAITEEIETCVRLSPAGQRTYRVIYFGRPTADKTERESDGSILYYFHSAHNQLFRYFIRFDPGDVEILYPNSLREKIYQHYADAMKTYE